MPCHSWACLSSVYTEGVLLLFPIGLSELLHKTLLRSEHERGKASSDSPGLSRAEFGFDYADA